MTFIEDPNGDARSLMNRAPCPCNGEMNGVQCKHYWAMSQKFRAANSEALQRGDIRRACKHVDGWMLEFTYDEKPTGCNHYTPRGLPGLVALVQRAVSLALHIGPVAGRMMEKSNPVTAGYMPYDKDFEAYKPVTLEMIEALRAEMPDRPVQGMFGKNPMSMTAQDIAEGEQIGMLKPGERIPNADGTLDAATEDALSGMFGGNGAEGIFNKKGDE